MMKLVKEPGLAGPFCKQMHFDQERNMLFCRMSTGILYIVQLFKYPVESSAFIGDMFQNYKESKNEKNPENTSRFCWVSRLNCYCEGTKLGFLKMRETQNKSECVLQLPVQFSDKVRLLYHDRTKNLLFAASKDGQYYAWKLPPEWQDPKLDKKLKELRRAQAEVNNAWKGI